MKCPHCAVEVNPNYNEEYIGRDSDGYWSIESMNCPNKNCQKLIIRLASGEKRTNHHMNIIGTYKRTSDEFIRPLTSTRPPIPTEVEPQFIGDYKEACLIQTLSPKASAALSRRCLQSILREKAGIKKGDLAKEIDQIIASNSLPSHLSKSIDAVRQIGNFAAHPIKSTSTGEIVEVEEGEAEWLLDVIESLFDFYFVQPAVLQAKKDALNQKLIDAGKPPMK